VCYAPGVTHERARLDRTATGSPWWPSLPRRGAAAAAVAALAACAAPAHDAPATERASATASAIQGGADDATHTFVVGITDGASTCSGTLIAPNLVLTARHCVADSGSSDVVDCATDVFSAPQAARTFRVTTDAAIAGAKTTFRGAKIFVPDDKKFCGNDIALLMLEANVPASVATPAAPVLSPKMTDHARYGTAIAAVGYGITGPGQSDDGKRRLRENVPLRCIPGDATLDCDPKKYDMTATEVLAGDGLCTGDSGSSAFDQATFATKPVTFGVLSRAAETQVRCIDAIYTRTDAFSELVVAAAVEASAAGGYPVPDWATASPSADGGLAAGDAGAGDAAPASDAAAAGPRDEGGGGCAAGSARPGPPHGAALILAGILALRRRRRPR